MHDNMSPRYLGSEIDDSTGLRYIAKDLLVKHGSLSNVLVFALYVSPLQGHNTLGKVSVEGAHEQQNGNVVVG